MPIAYHRSGFLARVAGRWEELVREIAAALSMIASCLIGIGPVSAAPRQRPIAFTDVTLLPMDRDVALPHRTVIVSGERIIAIGPAGTTPVPRGAQVIAGRGRFLMPGLADMHVHFLRPPTPGRTDEQMVFTDYLRWNRVYGLLEVANGVTSVRVMWGHPETDRLAERFASGEAIGPTIYSTGPVTDGDPPLWRGARVVTTPDQARAAVREDKADDRVAIKVYDRLSPALYQAIVDEAGKVDLPVEGHLPVAVPLSQAITAGQRSIEHADSFVNTLLPDPAMTHTMSFAQRYAAADPQRIVPYLPAMKSAGIWVCPTLAVYQMELPETQAIEGMEFFPAEFVERYHHKFNAVAYATHDTEMRFGLTLVRLLHQGGIPLLPGTDAFKVNVPPGFALLSELDLFVEAGLSPYDALRSATYDSARFLHQEAKFGSIAPGRRADLLLLDADPRAGLAALRKREGVMVRGRWYPEATLAAQLLGLRTEARRKP